MDRREQDGAEKLPGGAGSGAPSAHRRSGPRIARHDDVSQKAQGGWGAAGRRIAGALMKISTFDTTLRDGTQGESISFSVDDKLIIAQKLDELGIDYIEGGWPGSNPKDQEFFKRATDLTLHHARLTAFGSTRFAKNPVHEDRNVRALVEAGTPVVSIFGKTWDLHVKRALGITNDQNLVLISETVRYIKDHGKELVYDAEHFFDGYIADPDYALRTLEAAHTAGADVLRS